jgi:hypothetical protein
MKRIDGNHSEIVKALRAVGATVQSLAGVGRGCPDLLVGFGGRSYLAEVKNPAMPPSRRRLTVDELEWHQSWRGHVCVIETPEQAIAMITSQT